MELTRREWQVLELLAEHLTTAEIAQRLFVEQVTVRTHVASILRKLQVPSRQAALCLLKQGSGIDSPTVEGNEQE
jgi:DNA-binding NarL/FixJ family response regulator